MRDPILSKSFITVIKTNFQILPSSLNTKSSYSELLEWEEDWDSEEGVAAAAATEVRGVGDELEDDDL